MANFITVKVQGGDVLTEKSYDNVGEVKEDLGLGDYLATVNGDTADDEYPLADGNFVALNKPSKSGF